MTVFKGIIHVHSTYSYDGRHSISEIAAFARERGFAFVGMSEHSDTLDSEKVIRLREECQEHSTLECLIIPGIEFTCVDNLHLIGLGVQQYSPSQNPVEINKFIQQEGGIAIIAHPKRYQYQIADDLLSTVNGIEVWNAGYDGRFVPNDQSLTLLKSVRTLQDTPLAFGGQDLHKINSHHRQVYLNVCCDRLSSDAVLSSLRNGNFTISNGYVTLQAKLQVEFFKTLPIYLGSRFYTTVKKLRDRFV